MGFHMKITLNRTDRCNKYTHAQGIYVKSIYRLLKTQHTEWQHEIYVYFYQKNITNIIQ